MLARRPRAGNKGWSVSVGGEPSGRCVTDPWRYGDPAPYGTRPVISWTKTVRGKRSSTGLVRDKAPALATVEQGLRRVDYISVRSRTEMIGLQREACARHQRNLPTLRIDTRSGSDRVTNDRDPYSGAARLTGDRSAGVILRVTLLAATLTRRGNRQADRRGVVAALVGLPREGTALGER